MTIIISIISLFLTIVGFLFTFTNLPFFKMIHKGNSIDFMHFSFYEWVRDDIFIPIFIFIILINFLLFLFYFFKMLKIYKSILLVFDVFSKGCLIYFVVISIGVIVWDNYGPIETLVIAPFGYFILFLFIISIVSDFIALFLDKSKFFYFISSNYKYCPNCGKKFRSNDEYCRTCGEKLIIQNKYCQNCGKKLKLHDKYCRRCGKKINND